MIAGQQLIHITLLASWACTALGAQTKVCKEPGSSAVECAERANRDGGTALVQTRHSVAKHRGAHKVGVFDSESLAPALGMSHLESLAANVAEDGLSVAVTFKYAGKEWNYHLTSFSVYAKDAKVRHHTAQGTKEQLLRPPRNFQSRQDGKWASATLHQDRSTIAVTGLFQVQGEVVHVEPATQDHPEAISLLAKASAQSNAHHFRQFKIASLFAKQSLVPVDEGDGSHIPRFNATYEDEMEMALNLREWKGTKWWPGCYAGDDKLHDFQLGVIADVAAFKAQGDYTLPMIETVVAETSFVYEHQFHVKLVIGTADIYETETNAPSYASDCDMGIAQKIDTLAVTEIPFNAASHIFSGCRHAGGAAGMAFLGTICTRGMNVGLSETHNTFDWLVFAHELGHNFGGQHSFAEGMGTTGGIMDYGDGTLDGEYQFNTKYRKKEMCENLEWVVGNCRGKFDETEYPPTPAPPTPPPTPLPPTPPWTVVDGDCKKEGNCVTSPNYPDKYGWTQACTIKDAFGFFTVEDFEVEGGDKDYLQIGDKKYSGRTFASPDWRYSKADILWSSDKSFQQKGWKICSQGTEGPAYSRRTSGTCATLSLSDCKTVAASLEVSFRSRRCWFSSSCTPGCYHNQDENRVYFNENTDGQCTADNICFCKETTSATPRPTTRKTPSPSPRQTPKPTASPATPSPTLRPTKSPTKAAPSTGTCKVKNCNANKNEWTTKCKWKNCKGCEACTSSGAGPCKKSCKTMKKSWTKKCTWKSCAGCAECA